MASNVELVKLIGNRFIARKDVKAFQADDGAWYPDRTPMTMSDFEAHLAGTKTMGHYLLDQQDHCKLFAFDLDLAKHDRDCEDKTCKGGCVLYEGGDGITYRINPREMWQHPNEVYPDINPLLTMDLRCMAEGLAGYTHRTLGIPIAIATSGHKGLHVYGFTDLIPAEAARHLALQVLTGFGCFVPFRGENFWRHESAYRALEIEIFPKQTTLEGKDLGNLMKLPLGVHRVTKKRAEFLSCKVGMDTISPMDPERALEGDLPWE